MDKLRAIKGFKDILPADSPAWESIEKIAAAVFVSHGYEEIRTPYLEYTELFERSIGTQTDIVEKEMYTFTDAGGRSLTMRPENTAGVVRAYIENGLYKSRPRSKVYYIGPMFRRERPQKGRLRQFHQMGVEAFGSASPLVDAEQIAMLDMLFDRLGIKKLDIVVNSLGCPDCRPSYRDKLLDFLNGIPEEELCPSCIRRRVANPMRVLDCKEEKCRNALRGVPSIFDYLCDGCSEHHADLEKYLDVYNVSFRVEPKLVRGLDYYTRTAFEFLSGDLGSQSAVAAGGRYDYLVEELGGPSTAAVGFAVGMERLAMLIPGDVTSKPPDVFLALLGPVARDKGMKIAQLLRRDGIKCEMDYEKKGLKAQMKLADRLKSRFTMIIGESEVDSGEAVLQNMADGDKTKVNISGTEEQSAQLLIASIKES